eukprot:5873222-Amphidinium_carterae.1
MDAQFLFSSHHTPRKGELAGRPCDCDWHWKMHLMTNAMLMNSQIACCCQLTMPGNDITFLDCLSSETQFPAHAPQGGAGWLPVWSVASAGRMPC